MRRSAHALLIACALLVGAPAGASVTERWLEVQEVLSAPGERSLQEPIDEMLQAGAEIDVRRMTPQAAALVSWSQANPGTDDEILINATEVDYIATARGAVLVVVKTSAGTFTMNVSVTPADGEQAADPVPVANLLTLTGIPGEGQAWTLTIDGIPVVHVVSANQGLDDVAAAFAWEKRRSFGTDLNAGDKTEPLRNTGRNGLAGPVERIVIGDGNGPELQAVGEIENFSRRKGAV